MSSNDLAQSLVPTDAYLWLDEMPFTAWDQMPEGSLDLRVFDQDVYWVDIKRAPHFLTAMSRDYISNVIGFLLEHVESYYVGTMRRMSIQAIGDAMLGGGYTAQNPEVVSAIASLTPTEWLEQTTLMRGLRKRLEA